MAQFYQLIGLSLDNIYQNARANTSSSSNYSVMSFAAARAALPVRGDLQCAAICGHHGGGTTVPGQQATGIETAYQAQLYGSNIEQGDFNVFSLLYAYTQTAKTSSASMTERVPVGAAWRLGPRLSVVHQQLLSDGSNQLDLVPSALLDWQFGRNLMQFEGGYEIGKRDSSLQTQNTTRYYVSMSYRIAF